MPEMLIHSMLTPPIEGRTGRGRPLDLGQPRIRPDGQQWWRDQERGILRCLEAHRRGVQGGFHEHCSREFAKLHVEYVSILLPSIFHHSTSTRAELTLYQMRFRENRAGNLSNPSAVTPLQTTISITSTTTGPFQSEMASTPMSSHSTRSDGDHAGTM